MLTRETTIARCTTRTAAALSLIALLGLAACGDDDGDGDALASGAGDAAGTDNGCVLEGASEAEPDATVDVTLTEFALAPVPAEVTAGAVEFRAVNQGGEPVAQLLVEAVQVELAAVQEDQPRRPQRRWRPTRRALRPR